MLSNQMLEDLFQFFAGHFHQDSETINLLKTFLNLEISKHDKVKLIKEYSWVYCETEDKYIEFVEYIINEMKNKITGET